MRPPFAHSLTCVQVAQTFQAESSFDVAYPFDLIKRRDRWNLVLTFSKRRSHAFYFCFYLGSGQVVRLKARSSPTFHSIFPQSDRAQQKIPGTSFWTKLVI
jgi:hypothetical protein